MRVSEYADYGVGKAARISQRGHECINQVFIKCYKVFYYKVIKSYNNIKCYKNVFAVIKTAKSERTWSSSLRIC